MIKPEAVIFDMDGVIVDSEPRHERAFLDVMHQIGMGDSHGIRFSDYVGRSDEELWGDFLARNRPAQTMQELLALKRNRVVEIIRRDQPLFDGLVELVENLAARYPLALASGSEREVVDEVLKLKGLARFFPATVSCSEVKRGKPAPDVFLRAAQLLGVAPGRCYVIEDSKPGITAALTAGMQVIAITNTHPADELARATHVAGAYAEIERLLIDR